MATYDYACPKCDHHEDVQHSMNIASVTMQCPACKRASLVKQIGAPAFSFKAGSHVDPVYYGQLARRMPYGKPDPKAWFTSQSKAEDAAKRQADKTGEIFEKAT